MVTDVTAIINRLTIIWAVSGHHPGTPPGPPRGGPRGGVPPGGARARGGGNSAPAGAPPGGAPGGAPEGGPGGYPQNPPFGGHIIFISSLEGGSWGVTPGGAPPPRGAPRGPRGADFLWYLITLPVGTKWDKMEKSVFFTFWDKMGSGGSDPHPMGGPGGAG